MPIKSPDFWQKPDTFLSKVLSPFSKLYALVTKAHMKSVKPYRSKVPVICIGNLVMGGVGKTPLAISVAEFFKMNGKRPVFLTRGYGGGMSDILVDLDKHTAQDTGDEAMLLARVAPTVIDYNRARGAKTAEKIGADVIIMDDGFQNPKLYKDVSFAVFDGRYGFGNAKVFPAGPLREPLEQGLSRADAFIVVGQDKSGVKEWIKEHFPDLPHIAVHIEQPLEKIQQLAGMKVFAFAGIGFPEKFFGMLRDYGCNVVGTQAFSDHYPYTDADLTRLLDEAEKEDAVLVTTAKDSVRVPPRFKPKVTVVDAYSVWDTPDTMISFLSSVSHKG